MNDLVDLSRRKAFTNGFRCSEITREIMASFASWMVVFLLICLITICRLGMPSIRFFVIVTWNIERPHVDYFGSVIGSHIYANRQHARSDSRSLGKASCSVPTTISLTNATVPGVNDGDEIRRRLRSSGYAYQRG